MWQALNTSKRSNVTLSSVTNICLHCCYTSVLVTDCSGIKTVYVKISSGGKSYNLKVKWMALACETVGGGVINYEGICGVDSGEHNLAIN